MVWVRGTLRLQWIELLAVFGAFNVAVGLDAQLVNLIDNKLLRGELSFDLHGHTWLLVEIDLASNPIIELTVGGQGPLLAAEWLVGDLVRWLVIVGGAMPVAWAWVASLPGLPRRVTPELSLNSQGSTKPSQGASKCQ